MSVVAFSITHIYGREDLVCGPDEVIALCLVRDGEEYINAFIEHHLALGVKHIVFLDNGSKDGTIAIASQYPRVTVLQTRLPFRTYKRNFRAYLRDCFGRQGWTLCLDVDEFFDYPFSDRLRLQALLNYLNEHSYNAVLANMLEMFSDQALKHLEKHLPNNVKEEYRFYDLSGIERKPPSQHYICPNPQVREYYGGVRKMVFGIPIGPLRKYPLARLGTGLHARHIETQVISGGEARIADFSCVLFHYQFTGSLRVRCLTAIQEKSYAFNSRKYKRYYEVLRAHPHLNITSQTKAPQEFKQIDELLEKGFLIVSDDLKKLVEKQG
ncbi:MAG: glycosyltransferase family 2 protein [bacterium]|nr:glycosyltransferase family 2 protein [bacterium]